MLHKAPACPNNFYKQRLQKQRVTKTTRNNVLLQHQPAAGKKNALYQHTFCVNSHSLPTKTCFTAFVKGALENNLSPVDKQIVVSHCDDKNRSSSCRTFVVTFGLKLYWKIRPWPEMISCGQALFHNRVNATICCKASFDRNHMLANTQ